MIPLPLVTPDDSKQIKQGFAQVVENAATGQKSIHSTSFFDAGELICIFSAGATYSTPTYLTIQTGVGKHITLLPEYLQYTNHSCDPNIFFDTSSMEVVALKTIQPGDELTFFYPSTEWDMAQPFGCNCASANCLHHIQGAAYLSEEILKRYKLTAFIEQQLKNRPK